MIITIDGPAATGKSSVAHLLAQDLDYIYINTGLLYRAVAYILMTEYHYTLKDMSQPTVIDVYKVVEKTGIKYRYHPQEGASITYRSHNITPYLKKAEIGDAASQVSLDPYVRQALLTLQRKLADENNVIAEGRDCGTVVFPHAKCKFFLTATLEVRAVRWQKEQEQLGVLLNFDQAKRAVIERDTRDSTRTIAPLAIPHNARVINNSGLTIAQTVDAIKEHVKKCVHESGRPLAAEEEVTITNGKD